MAYPNFVGTIQAIWGQFGDIFTCFCSTGSPTDLGEKEIVPQESICAVTSSAAWERPCRHILGSHTGPLPKPRLQRVMLSISREWRRGGGGVCG